METNLFVQIAEAWGPYIVAIVVTIASLLFQWLFEKQRSRREWEKFLAQKSLDACLTLVGMAKAVADEYMAARDSQSLEMLRTTAKDLKEYADYSKPLLPRLLQEELHTAAYHIWGRVESLERSEFSIEVLGKSIASLQNAREKLTQFVSASNPVLR